MVSVVLFVSLLGPARQTNSTLDGLERVIKSSLNQQPLDDKKIFAVNEAVMRLAEKGELKTSSDYLRASRIVSTFQTNFDYCRIKHELCLAALVLGEPGARTEIKRTWDGFIISTGREQHIGTVAAIPGWEKFKVSPAPKSIRDLMLNPDKFIAAAKTAIDNHEVTKICSDDQAAREDFNKMTAAQMNEMAQNDKKRLKSIVKLLEDGRVVTPKDFDHASLVLQHGEVWGDYSLAHELAICSLIMGNQDSAWLAAATYDRMLESGGHHQRFGTQYKSFGNSGFMLGTVDTVGISDAQRKVMHCPTLEQAKNRKWD